MSEQLKITEELYEAANQETYKDRYNDYIIQKLFKLKENY